MSLLNSNKLTPTNLNTNLNMINTNANDLFTAGGYNLQLEGSGLIQSESIMSSAASGLYSTGKSRLGGGGANGGNINAQGGENNNIGISGIESINTTTAGRYS